MKKLDSDFIAKNFPALGGDWTYFDNAGGTQVARQVGERLNDYLYNTNVQLGASYNVSVESGEKIANAQSRWAEAINAQNESEVILGSSTTALLQNLSRSIVQLFKPGDEVIVTNSDHEANVGPWINMEKDGIVVKVWYVNPDTLQLELNDLEKLMSDRTKLVAFTHVSNILGTINPVKEITKFIHDHGALSCVDGVAFAPHRFIDVKLWDVDFYVFSLYKVYGPHYSLLYGKKQILDTLPGINHFFIGNDDIPYKLQPGNVNYELTVACNGILDYLDDCYKHHFGDATASLFSRITKVFDLFAQKEEDIVKPLIEYLRSKNNVKIIGENSYHKNDRVPTVSFTVENMKSSEIPLLVDPHNIGIRWGDFYARRLIDDLGLSRNDGVVRVSLVHYNNLEEVHKLIKVLDTIF